MTFEEITHLIKTQFGDGVGITQHSAGLMPYITINADSITEVCDFLYRNPQMYFDYLACMTGIDLGAEAGKIEIAYNLYSIPYDTKYCIKISVNRNELNTTPLPTVKSVSHIWRTADWHEREMFDLVGVNFDGHPDLRRILLPADWEGHPLRKDNKTQEYYHEIKVAY